MQNVCEDKNNVWSDGKVIGNSPMNGLSGGKSQSGSFELEQKVSDEGEARFQFPNTRDPSRSMTEIGTSFYHRTG
jgi:hypothetical protein